MDKYQRLRKIGEGAFGKAFLVRHKGSNRQCVVKEINIVKMSPKEREEARKEVAVLAQLKHPNIVAYIESFEESGTLHIVMNYCAGGDLYSKINSQRGMLFPEEQIWNWFVQICLALKHIHDRKILHRDIKSQNIFLTMNGVVQLGDFGIAKVLNNTVELAKTCIGTPYYLSPEIVENKPYNNKSDIWSLGCVLYELTTHKHAFEAGNMKNLVLKIIRGSYPPIPPQYSYDLRGLIAQLLKRGPRDRPSINSVLQKNFIMQRVRSLLSAEVIADEFSHTVMHGAKVAKVLPPGPRPSSAPKKEVLQRPGSAGRKYDPTPVYGRPLSARKSQGRSSGELKKKAAGGGGRPLPVPGQLEWGQKKKEMLDKEQKHREEIKKQQQDEVAQRHRNFVEKQKMDRINKSREEGWKNLIDQPEGKKDMPQSPHAGGDARPLPLPKQQPDPGQPNFLENRKPRQPGNYEDYHAYLDKLKNQRLEREKALDQRSAEYMVAIKVPAQQNNGGNNSDSGPQGWNPTPAVLAVQQANYNRQMAEQAAERAKLVEDYMIRRREAAKNKARGQAELFGHRPPSGAGRPSPIPRPRQERPQVKPVRNKEEEEYLEKLQQIREQNWHERRAIRKKMGDDDHIAEKKEKEAEERRKKKEALKQQADDWAKKKRDELEQERQKLLNSQIVAGDKAKQPPVAPPSRPSSAKARMRPAPAVPITGVLQVIGAGVEAASPVPGKAQLVPPAGEPEVLQQKKQEILKKLNQQTPARGKWGAGGVEVPSAEAVEMRGKWGRQAASPLAVMQAETPEPESSRSQWDKEEKLRLSNLPLEQTASQMEVTSARDQVIKNPGSVGETPPSARNQWGRPGSTVVKALNKLPVYEGTVTLDNNSSQEGAENSASAGNTPPVIGSTVTLSKAPAPGPAPPPIPSVRPPVRSGTITIKAADTAPSPTPTPSEDIQKPGVVEGKEQDPGAAANAEGQGLTGGPDKKEQADGSRKGDLIIEDRSHSVQKGLTTGNYDIRDVQLLRTCSEPDLTRLFRGTVKCVQATLQRPQSLEMEQETESQSEDSSQESEEEAKAKAAGNVAAAENEVLAEKGDNNDEDCNEFSDDEEEELMNLRATMQSLLIDNDDDAGTPPIGKVKFNLSGSVESTLKVEEDKVIEEEEKSQTTEKTKAGEDAVVQPVLSKGSPIRSKSDSVLVERCEPGDGGDNQEGEETEDELDYNVAEIFNMNDSDDETIFGDDDGDDDLDLYSRLEQQRAELERELGFDKFVQVYKTVQALQEDEDENMEEGARIAIDMLGQDKQHLYPRIFQLVMADTAFTEDNV